MGRKASHHFVPASYLAGFTEDGTKESAFWSVPTNNTKSFVTSPIKSCKKRDYYTIEHNNSLLVEDWYATEIEPKINYALRHIEEKQTLLSNDKMQHLLILVATLYLRTPTNRARLEEPLRAEKEIIDSMSKEIKISNKESFEYCQTDLIKTELRLINTVMNCLCNKYYRLFIINEPDLNFITSDNPFVLSHPYETHKNFYYGLNTPGVTLFVPISRKAALIGMNEPFEEGTYVANKKLVGSLNHEILLRAEKFCYTATPDICRIDSNGNPLKYKIKSNVDN